MSSKASPMMRRPPGKPEILINSNFDKPPERRFIKRPKKKKAGIKPHQKRFSLVAKSIPFPARLKPSHHFLQFINIIIAQIKISRLIFIIIKY